MVDREMQNATDAPPTIIVRPGGGQFRPGAGDLINISTGGNAGSGWWEYRFAADEVATVGNLIIEARHGNNPAWRDIILVEEAAGLAGGTESDQAGISAPDSRSTESDPDLITNGDFSNGSANWSIYCPRGLDVSPENGGLRVRRFLEGSNCQLFQKLALTPGDYKIYFEANSLSASPVDVGLRLIEHRGSYRNLGLDKLINVSAEGTTYRSTITVPKGLSNQARIMLWFVPMQPGSEILIRCVSLIPI